MRFSVWPNQTLTWPEIREDVVACDRAGWDGAWFADHFMPNTGTTEPASGPTHEWGAVLAALAPVTERIRLGPLVASLTYRHPAVLAAMASSISQVSNGRFVLGVGAGWQLNEHHAYGIELGSLSERSDRLEEGCAALRSLLHEPSTTLQGAHFRFVDAPCDPKPVGSLPLLVAGKGERRTLRTAALHADEWNGWCTPAEMVHKRAVLARHCDEIDRDPSTIGCSTQAFVCISDDRAVQRDFVEKMDGFPRLVGSTAQLVDQVGEFATAGTDELIIPTWHVDDASARAEMLETLWTEVFSALR